jgi:branched-chain amino acid transport system ATP-binding protein
MSLLDVQAVRKNFGGLRALDDISFSVEPGEIVGLMGANGAGKTTLFSVIAGHVKADQGIVNFKDTKINHLSPHKICRAGIARTFQIVRPFGGMTVRENIETGIIFGSSSRLTPLALEELTDTILQNVNLNNMADKLASTLTLSDRKRLEVARALGTGPELLLLDEVMAGLTPFEVEKMIETIRQVKVRYSLTIIVVEHVVRALVDLSERLVVLHHGHKIAEGEPDEIANHPAVLEAYFGQTAS